MTRPASKLPSRAEFDRMFGHGSDPIARLFAAHPPQRPSQARPTVRVFVAGPTGPAAIVDRFA